MRKNFVLMPWIAAPGLPEPACVLLEARIPPQNASCYFQLDTGCDANILYQEASQFYALVHISLHKKLPAKIAEFFLKRKASAQKMESKIINFLEKHKNVSFVKINGMGICCDGNKLLVGTLGLDFILDSDLILDFKNRQIYLGDDDFSAGSRIEFTRKNNKLFLHDVYLNGIHLEYVIYDTGASPFELVLTSGLLEKLKSDNWICQRSVNGRSWKNKIQVDIFQTDSNLRIGGKLLQKTSIAYTPAIESLANQLGLKELAVLGNQPFLDGRIKFDSNAIYFQA
jgi:hypothetical protein